MLECRLIVNVSSVPRVPLLTVSDDFLGMVVNVFEAEVYTVPLETPVINDAEHATVLVPSVLWLTSTVFV